MLAHYKPLSTQRIECNAFSHSFRAIAVVLCVGCAGWLAWLWFNGKLNGMGNFTLVWLALGMMGLFMWAILRSTTSVSPAGLAQTWIWNKTLPFGEVVYAKLFRIRGLEQLIAPRLYVRSASFKSMTFYACDDAVLDEFLRIENALRTINGLPTREK